MSDPPSAFSQLFFEAFEGLPRQGPGNHASTRRALSLCAGLPERPQVLDLGCGVGAQTLHLAELTAGSIVAVDNHAPNIERLRATVAARGLGERVRPMVADMAHLPLPSSSFDLVWSEGALYNIGLERALGVAFEALRPGGYLAFTDAVWRKDDPPPAVKALFEADYPTMGWASDVVATSEKCGFVLIDHFALPDEAWWDDFYTPMEARIAQLRLQHAGDPETLAALDALSAEPEMHRRFSAFYNYEFFVLRRPL